MSSSSFSALSLSSSSSSSSISSSYLFLLNQFSHFLEDYKYIINQTQFGTRLNRIFKKLTNLYITLRNGNYEIEFPLSFFQYVSIILYEGHPTHHVFNIPIYGYFFRDGSSTPKFFDDTLEHTSNYGQPFVSIVLEKNDSILNNFKKILDPWSTYVNLLRNELETWNWPITTELKELNSYQCFTGILGQFEKEKNISITNEFIIININRSAGILFRSVIPNPNDVKTLNSITPLSIKQKQIKFVGIESESINIIKKIPFPLLSIFEKSWTQVMVNSIESRTKEYTKSLYTHDIINFIESNITKSSENNTSFDWIKDISDFSISSEDFERYFFDSQQTTTNK